MTRRQKRSPSTAGLWVAFAGAGLSLIAPTGGQAQAGAEPAAPCRLHVWPSAGLKAQRIFGLEYAYTGIGKGDIESTSNDTAISNFGVNPTFPLAPADQKGLLARAGLDKTLDLGGYELVMHEVPLTSTVLRTVKSRYAEGESTGCYADLVVSDVVLSSEYARGINLRVFLRFRQFGPDAAPTRSFATWVQSKLPIDKKEEPRSERAKAVLESGFLDTLTNFGGLLRKQLAAK